MILKVKKDIAQIQKKMGIVGRDTEIESLLHCVQTGKNILLEGPVGVGKTFLVQAVSQSLGRKVFRLDGDARYTEQKLTGWFDPPSVLKKGYTANSFFPGPLMEAMQSGGILFINELNRMPEGVQNILLPALDEKQIEIPRVGTVKAKKGFVVIATQNPKEFVATSHLSEALLDRFELICLDYQPIEDERNILCAATDGKNKELLEWSLTLARATRESPLFKRGASVRAAISIYDIAQSLGGSWESFLRATLLALPNRIELNDEGTEQGLQKTIDALIPEVKKKALK
jgi:MoxR-like ATPase